MKTTKIFASFLFAAVLSAPAMASFESPVTDKPVRKAVTYTIVPQKSTLAWHGKKVTGEHNGTVDINKGNLVFDGTKLTGGMIEIDMKSVKDLDLKDAGYNKKLTTHLMSDDFFNAEKFPVSTLKITKVTPKGGTNYEVTGDLTIRGKTNPVVFPATVTLDGGSATTSAKIVIDRSKYDVKFGSKSFFENIGDKMIYDEFDLTVNLVSTK